MPIDTHKLAQALASLVEGPAAAGPTLRPLVRGYLAAQAPHVVQAHHTTTRRRLEALLGDLAERAQGHGRRLEYVSDLDPAEVSAWMRSRLDAGMAPATVRQHVAALKTALSWGVEQDMIERSPLDRVRLPAVGRGRQTRPRGRPTPEQVKELLAAAAEQDRRRPRSVPQLPLLWVLVRTGIRRGEAVLARRGDYDRAGAVLRIRAENAKTRRGRTIPLDAEDCAVIDRACAALDSIRGTQGADGPLFASRHGYRLSPRNVSRWLDLLLADAGIDKQTGSGETLCLHSLRHAAGDLLASANLRAAQILLGHSSTKTTEHYLHDPDADFLRSQMSRLGRPSVSDLWQETTPRQSSEGCPKPHLPTKNPAAGVPGGVSEGNRTPDPQNHKMRSSCRHLPQTDQERSVLVEWLPAGTRIEIPSVSALRALLSVSESIAALLQRGPVTIEGVGRG